jgi:hypothetical protein
MMTSAFQIAATHGRGYPSNVVSQRYGDHIPSVKLATDTDNGQLIAVGAWAGWDYFDEAAVTTFTGKVIAQDKNGDWLVLVTDPGDACLVYQKPLTPYETPTELLNEKTMYNKADDIVRAYVLTKFDRFTSSTENFDASALPAGTTNFVGKSVTGVANKKLVLA